MNFKKLFSLSLLVLAMTVFFASANYAQVLTTVYVNSTNGDDGYTGANELNDPAGTGPKQTLEGGFAAVKDGGTIYVDGGTYNIDGSARTDLNGIVGGDDSDGITLAGGKSVIIIVRTFASFATVTIPAGGLTVNNGTKTITVQATTLETEGITVSGGLNLTAGVLNVSGLGTKFTVNASTITRAAGSIVGAPTYSSSGNYSVTYNNTAAALNSGPELPADLNDGTLTFSGTKAVTVGSTLLLNDGAITTATSTATFSASVTFEGAATGANGIKVTGNGGSLTFGAVTINSHAALGATYVNVGNAGGSLSITALTFQNNSTSSVGPAAASMTIANTGTATVGQITEVKATVSSTDYAATVSIDNNGAKTFSLGTASLTGTITNDGTGKLALTGNVSTSGILDNTNSTVQLGVYTLTLTGAVTHDNSGGTFTDGGGKLVFNKNAVITVDVTGGGTFATTENANTGLVTISGGASTFTGNLISTKGGFTLTGGAATLQKDLNVVSGTVTFASAANSVKNISLTGGGIDFTGTTMTVNGNIDQSNGNFNYNAAVVTLKGNLNRTGGTVTPGTGGLTFNASGSQAFNGGANYVVNDLSVAGISTAVTFQSSLVVNGDASITATNSVALSTYNIRMAGDGATFTLTGSYSSTGGGGIIFQAPTADQNIAGTGVYSNIEVNLGDATTFVVVGDNQAVRFSGILTTTSGGIQVSAAAAATTDFDPVNTLTTPTIRVNLADNDGATNGTNVPKGTGITLAVAGGTERFNNAGTAYNLEYFGAVDGTAQGVTDEYVVGDLLSLTVNTTGQLNLPNATATMSGDLTVGPAATLTLATGAAQVYTLDKDGGVYTIRGTVNFTDGNGANEDALTIDGASATINGYSVKTDPAYVNANLNINSTTQATVSGIKTFNQPVTTGAGSVVSFGMYTDGTGDLDVNGLLTVGGGFDLTSKFYANAGVTVTGGTLNLATYDIEFHTTAQTFTTDKDVLSSGGKLLFTEKTATPGASLAANIAAGGKKIPYITIVNPFPAANTTTVTLTADLEVSSLIDIQEGGYVALGANDLYIAGTIKTVDDLVLGTGSITGTGAVIFIGSTLEIDDANGNATVTWPNVTVDSDTANTTTIVSTTGDPMTLVITGALTQTIGNIDQGDNDIQLTGGGTALTRVEGNIVQGDGALIFAGTANQDFAPSQAWSIKNLTIDNAGNTVSTSDSAFTVTGNLNLVNGDFSTTDEGLLHLGDLATINIDAVNASLNDEVPTFDGLVNVAYNTTAGGTTGVELPTSTTAVNDLIINASVTLGANVVVNDTLKLNAGTLTNDKTVTLDSSAAILDAGGDMTKAPVVTSYNLKYTANSSAAKEFVSGKINQLEVYGVTLTLADNSTVNDIVMTKSGSSIALAGKTLTTTGDLNIPSGSVTGAGSLTLGGSAVQELKAPAGGLNLAAKLTLDNEAGFTLTGGNLTMGNDIVFVNGVLKTDDNEVVLNHTVNGMGFDHTGVADTNASHINGNVKIALASGDGASGTNGRFEFPVGSATKYRPYAITFNSNDPVINPTNVVVKHIDENPEGIKNLPIKINDNLSIGSYPDYYWLVKTTPSSFSSQQLFDVEIVGTNVGIPYTSDQQLRMLKRQDGSSLSNGWSIEGGVASIYSNFQVVNTLEDTTVYVRTAANIGGLTVTGVRYTIGVPTRAPFFTAPAVLADTMNEGATKTIQVTADPQDVGETVAYSLVGAPSWAAINATTGLLTLTPDFSIGSATAYEIIIRATDSGGAMSELTLAILVVDANRAPAFSTAPTEGTIKYGSTLTLTYVAADSDGDAVTYSVTSVPAPSVAPTITAALGVVTFTPAFADAGDSFVFEVVAADGKGGADTVETVVTVQYAKEKGDVNLDGSITSADATPILKYVVGSATLTDEQQYYAKVNSDDQIGSLDAAWVLYYAVNGSFPSAKVAPAIASTEFGQLSKVAANSTEGLQVNNGEFTLPVSFKQTTGVVSVYAEFQLSGAIDFESVTPRLPEGWLYASSFENGVLKIAMAGVNPLADGNIANINVKMMDKEATGTIQGFTKLNDNVVNNLNAIKVKEIPAQFALSQNYPNPFNPTTSIKFQLPENANVTLEIYNMLGQRVKSLINGQQESGYYTVNWDGTNDFGSRVSSGIYIYRISAGKFVSTLKMNLLK